MLGEIFRGKASEGAVPGEFFRGMGPAWRSRLLEGPINLLSSFSWARSVNRPWRCGVWAVDNEARELGLRFGR